MLSIVNACVICKRLRGKVGEQFMSDLPVDRVQPSPPFTVSGVDLFGPFLVKEGRSERKRWGVIFTCMSMRAVHLEVAHSLTTDSFLNCYRRFVCRRGPVRVLRCDQGTNFIGAKNELQSALQELDKDKIRGELARQACDLVEFNFNVPRASHMGGAWERMIKSVRSTLSAIFIQHGKILDDDSLHTFLLEAENIVNSRPITSVDSDLTGQTLTPNMILTFKGKSAQAPPGEFVKEDLYTRKRWRRVQFLSDLFWSKWRKEYLPSLQARSKWRTEQENFQVGDIVLLKEETLARCNWPYGRVAEVYASTDERIRKVRVVTGSSAMDRPIAKLVLLYRPGCPDEEP